MQSVSANYETEEAKMVGARPDFYVAFDTETFEVDDDVYAAGTHTNTEVSSSKLQLVGGQNNGNWVSANLDTGHLTPNVIFDRITWEETLNGGTVTVEIKTAATEGGLAAAGYVEYTSGTYNHTERYRWWKLKISLTKGSSSPQVWDVELTHKALIPKNEVQDAGTIDYGISIDFLNPTSGDVTVTVSNEDYQWERRQATSYVYGKDIFDKKFEVWAGFYIPGEGEVEWLCQFVGLIQDYEVTVDELTAAICATDLIFAKLDKTVLGAPASDGTPAPYMHGKRYRVRCKQSYDDAEVYEFYVKGSISSIDAVYVRDTNAQRWIAAPTNTPDAANKKVTFDTDPMREVAVDITIDSTDHPIDIIEDILENEVGLSAEQIDSAGTFATSKTRCSQVAVGCAFENTYARSAIAELLKILHASFFVERGVAKIIKYYPDLTVSGQAFTDTTNLYRSLVRNSLDECKNKIRAPYGNYTDDKREYVERYIQTSLDLYGEKSITGFSFTYEDPVSSTSATDVAEAIEHLVMRLNDAYELIEIEVANDILRSEIMDIITATVDRHNISASEFYLLSELIQVSEYGGTVRAIQYPGENWLYWDTGEGDRYLVDYPVPPEQEEYEAYYY